MKRSKNNNWLWVVVLILLFQLGKWIYRHDWSQNNQNLKPPKLTPEMIENFKKLKEIK